MVLALSSYGPAVNKMCSNAKDPELGHLRETGVGLS